MNNDIKKWDQIISAYLDDELSAESKQKFEEELSSNNLLKEKLHESMKIKQLLKDNYKEIPEDEFFTTRVLGNLNTKKGRSSRLIPALTFSVLTGVLLLILGLNPKFVDNFIDTQKSSLTAFYKENLKPVLLASDLSPEDIFNFAFYKQLPIDEKNNEYLLLGYDTHGNEYFEIQKASFEPGNNLERFSNSLQLNEEQKQKVDSILNSYAPILERKVLANDQKTLAISPVLWNYNKAIANDIIKYVYAVNKQAVNIVMPKVAQYCASPENLSEVNTIKNHNSNEYIFFTPDSMFKEKYNYKHKFDISKEEFKKMQKELDLNLKEMRVQLRNMEIPDVHIPDMDSIIKNINKEIRIYTFDNNNGKLKKGGREMNFKIHTPDSTFTMHFNIPDTDSIMQNMPDLAKLNIHIADSLNLKFKHFLGDSLRVLNQREFNIQMEQLEKEMKRFKEDMKKMQKELRKERKNAEPVEI